jgi:hypothetical protein
MAEEKSTASSKQAAEEKAPGEGGLKDGVFDGTVRYEGSILVERDIDGETVTVLTDKPRRGDRIQANELNTATGEMQRSTKRADEGSATPPRR